MKASTSRQPQRTRKRLAKKEDAPPEGSCWIWITAEILESPAWLALPHSGRDALIAVMQEHLRRGRVENGNLKVPYIDFEKRGMSPNSIADGIAHAEALGWMKVRRGRRASAERRYPSIYTLTWLWDRSSKTAPFRRRTYGTASRRLSMPKQSFSGSRKSGSRNARCAGQQQNGARGVSSSPPVR